MFFRKSEGDPAREVGSSGAGDGEFMSKDVGPARSAGWARCRAILERLSVLSELERLGTTQMSPGSDKITKTRGDIGSKLQLQSPTEDSHLTCSYPPPSPKHHSGHSSCFTGQQLTATLTSRSSAHQPCPSLPSDPPHPLVSRLTPQMTTLCGPPDNIPTTPLPLAHLTTSTLNYIRVPSTV